MDWFELQRRTKQFARRIMRLEDALPDSRPEKAIGNQVVRSGTSIGANHRAACRARSRAEFVVKLGVVLEEADETFHWLELITEGGLVPIKKMEPLLPEANELPAIFARSRGTVRQNLPVKKS